MHLVFLGPPASGKGTLSQILTESLDLTPISTGVLLRRHVEEGTPLGLQAEEYMAKSALVPDEIVQTMLSEWFNSNQSASWLLDGFPRTVPQARWLEKEVKGRGIEIDVAVSLSVSREILEGRIKERLQCQSCGFTTARSLNNDSTICPKCEGQLVSRADDALATFQRRYQDFLDQTAPVIEFYREQGNLLEVAAEGQPEQVAALISRELAAKA